jgi:hypothetical protein
MIASFSRHFPGLSLKALGKLWAGACSLGARRAFQVKVVIASGHVRLQEWAGGADAVFAKPFDVNQVLARINQLVASARAKPNT